jgi:hypothetical protein
LKILKCVSFVETGSTAICEISFKFLEYAFTSIRIKLLNSMYLMLVGKQSWRQLAMILEILSANIEAIIEVCFFQLTFRCNYEYESHDRSSFKNVIIKGSKNNFFSERYEALLVVEITIRFRSFFLNFFERAYFWTFKFMRWKNNMTCQTCLSILTRRPCLLKFMLKLKKSW